MNPHPNATAGGIGGILATVILALLAKYGVHVDQTQAALITSATVAVALVIGKDGLLGLADVIVHGQTTRPPSQQALGYMKAEAPTKDAAP